MSNTTDRLVLWSPRVLAILVAGFLGVFAADVFEQGAGLWDTAIGLTIHLIPTWVVLGVLVASWRRAGVGAIAYPGLGALYLVLAWGRFHWSAYAMIAGPLFVLGALFALAWVRGRGHRATTA